MLAVFVCMPVGSRDRPFAVSVGIVVTGCLLFAAPCRPGARGGSSSCPLCQTDLRTSKGFAFLGGHLRVVSEVSLRRLRGPPWGPTALR